MRASVQSTCIRPVHKAPVKLLSLPLAITSIKASMSIWCFIRAIKQWYFSCKRFTDSNSNIISVPKDVVWRNWRRVVSSANMLCDSLQLHCPMWWAYDWQVRSTVIPNEQSMFLWPLSVVFTYPALCVAWRAIAKETSHFNGKYAVFTYDRVLVNARKSRRVPASVGVIKLFDSHSYWTPGSITMDSHHY